MSAAAAAAPERLLVVFTRFPEPGRTKTRLIPALGAEGAARLQREMTERTLARLAPRAASGGTGGVTGEDQPLPHGVEVRYAGGDDESLRAWLGAGRRLAAQGAGDLGERLRRAFAEAFAGGARQVVVVGCDCPGLGTGDVRDAFAALGGHDAVFGPASDGGYYLVGMRSASATSLGRLFAGIGWGGPEVLAESRAAAAAAGLGVALLRTLPDVDRPADLAVWERALRVDASGAPITVVVPVLNEADRIGPLVEALLRDGAAEVVVTDGGSGDGSAGLAAAMGARVVPGTRGRAAQMNAGAAAATGEILLFLHADTRLPAGWGDAVRALLLRRGVVAGAFSFGTDSRRRSLRLIEALANWRGRRLGIFFGDQGLFLRRRDFEALGGFPDQPLLEDYAFVRALRRRGAVVILPQRATTSARRWEARGPWRTSVRNVAITAAGLAGVSPRTLSRWYRGPASDTDGSRPTRARGA